MNNLIISMKRFLKNKNTVTILGVIAIVAILYFGYNAQIRNQTQPIKVPVAAVTLQPRTVIDKDMIELVDVPAMYVNLNTPIKSMSLLIGKEVAYNTVIPKGSMFYDELVLDPKEQPDSILYQVKEGDEVFSFKVDMDSTYGNSITPGSKIDIFMKAENDEDQIMVGKLIENIEVIDVKDSEGRHVFENSEEKRRPATLLFGVKPDIAILLWKAQYLKSYYVELFPVPHGGTAVEGDLDVAVSSENLKEFINSHTVINDELIKEEMENNDNQDQIEE